MLNRVFSTVLLLIFLISPAVIWAMEIPPGKWWRRPQVSKELNLTEEEISKLDKQFIDNRRKLIKLESAVKSELFELDNILDSENLDEKATVKQFDKLQQARTNLANEQFRSLLEIRKILGLERFRQLKMLKKLHRQKMRRELRSLQNRPKERPGPEG